MKKRRDRALRAPVNRRTDYWAARPGWARAWGRSTHSFAGGSARGANREKARWVRQGLTSS